MENLIISSNCVKYMKKREKQEKMLNIREQAYVKFDFKKLFGNNLEH